MKILVDTTVWSLALRRKRRGMEEQKLVDELTELVLESRVALIGPIRQEILSGIAEPQDFLRVKTHLSAFSDLPLEARDYEDAAGAYNVCRAKGVQGSHTDFLICAVSARYAAPIFTTDKDFQNFVEHLPITLFQARKR